MERGIYFAFIAFVMWGFIGVGYRVANINFGADYILFACIELLFGSLALLAIGGKGIANKRTLLTPHSWIWSIARVINAICFMIAVSYLTTTEVLFSIRIYVIISLIMAWVFMERKPLKTDWIGILPIIGGTAAILYHIPFSLLHIAIICTFAVAFLESFMSLITEIHPVSNSTIGIRDRCRYTGTLLGITSFFFIIAAIIFSFIFPEGLGGYSPNISQLLDWRIMLFAFLIGAIFRAPSMYMYLLSIRLAKSENVRMAGTIGPFIVLALESILNTLGILKHTGNSVEIVLAGVAISAGALFMMFCRVHQNRKTQRIKEDIA